MKKWAVGLVLIFIALIEATAILAADTTAPNVTIGSPSTGSIVGGNSVSVSASATDNVMVSSMKVFLTNSGGSTSQICNPSYGGSSLSCNWVSTSVSDGSYTITVHAWDNATPANDGSSHVTISVDNTAPSVYISAPPNGGTVSGSSVNIYSYASDNNAVSYMKIFLTNTATGITNQICNSRYDASSANCYWNSTSVSDGSYRITVHAWDAVGNDGSTYVSINVQNADLTPPTVTIQQPSNGAVLSNSVSIMASATDNEAVSYMKVFLTNSSGNTVQICNPSYGGSSLSCSWDSTTMPDGSYRITVHAWDTATPANDGSSYVSVTVRNADTTAPIVSIQQPSNGQTVSGSASIIASATDNVAVAYMKVFLTNSSGNTTQICDLKYNASSLACSWDSTATPNGSYTLTVHAWDVATNDGKAQVSITVNNQQNVSDNVSPAVTIMSPLNLQTVSAIVPITATATDNVAVAYMKVFLTNSLGNTTQICDLRYNASSLGCSWDSTNVSDGDYKITVHAWDTSMNDGKSDINVTIENICTPGVGMPLAGMTIPGSLIVPNGLYGWRWRNNSWQNHTGIDIRASFGTPVFATEEGFVSSHSYLNDLGYYVCVGHTGNYSTVYAHLSKNDYFNDSQTVCRGQLIGNTGISGDYGGTPHLHFAVYNGKYCVAKPGFRHPCIYLGVGNYYDCNSPYSSTQQNSGNTSNKTTVSVPAVINKSVTKAIMYLEWAGDNPGFTIKYPNGTEIGPNVSGQGITYVENDTYKYYEIENPDIGNWTMDLRSSDNGTDYTLSLFLFENESEANATNQTYLAIKEIPAISVEEGSLVIVNVMVENATGNVTYFINDSRFNQSGNVFTWAT